MIDLTEFLVKKRNCWYYWTHHTMPGSHPQAYSTDLKIVSEQLRVEILSLLDDIPIGSAVHIILDNQKRTVYKCQ